VDGFSAHGVKGCYFYQVNTRLTLSQWLGLIVNYPTGLYQPWTSRKAVYIIRSQPIFKFVKDRAIDARTPEQPQKLPHTPFYSISKTL
jgi:hypothetical protein